jgi:hypothetical protein
VTGTTKERSTGVCDESRNDMKNSCNHDVSQLNLDGFLVVQATMNTSEVDYVVE